MGTGHGDTTKLCVWGREWCLLTRHEFVCGLTSALPLFLVCRALHSRVIVSETPVVLCRKISHGLHRIATLGCVDWYVSYMCVCALPGALWCSLVLPVFSEWASHQHRDTIASHIGHYDRLSYFSVAENEAVGRTRFKLMEVRVGGSRIRRLRRDAGGGGGGGGRRQRQRQGSCGGQEGACLAMNFCVALPSPASLISYFRPVSYFTGAASIV